MRSFDNALSTLRLSAASPPSTSLLSIDVGPLINQNSCHTLPTSCSSTMERLNAVQDNVGRYIVGEGVGDQSEISFSRSIVDVQERY